MNEMIYYKKMFLTLSSFSFDVILID